jgi:hypothetical protein
MRIVTVVLLAMIPASVHSSQPKPVPATGSVCVAAVEPPNGGEKSLANPAGGNRVQHYSIRIDDLPLVHTAPDKGFRTAPLEYSKKHVVRVFGDGKPVASFYFKFSEFKSNELCLFFNSLYETWQLWDMKSTGKWCARDKTNLN